MEHYTAIYQLEGTGRCFQKTFMECNYRKAVTKAEEKTKESTGICLITVVKTTNIINPIKM